MTKCRVCQNEHAGSCASFFSSQSTRATRRSQPPAEVANVSNKVVDTAPRAKRAAVVDARTGDRHRKTDERREYLRLAQRRSRAARRVSGVAP